MGAFAAGQVSLVQFPYSDLSGDKLRPVLLLRDLPSDDWICCQTTSRPFDSTGIPLSEMSFASGGLDRLSFVRYGKLFTANEKILSPARGQLRPEVLLSVRMALIRLLKTP